MSEGKRLDDVGGGGEGWLTLYSKKVRSSARELINKRMSEGKRLDDVGGGGGGWLTLYSKKVRSSARGLINKTNE